MDRVETQKRYAVAESTAPIVTSSSNEGATTDAQGSTGTQNMITAEMFSKINN